MGPDGYEVTEPEQVDEGKLREAEDRYEEGMTRHW